MVALRLVQVAELSLGDCWHNQKDALSLIFKDQAVGKQCAAMKNQAVIGSRWLLSSVKGGPAVGCK